MAQKSPTKQRSRFKPFTIFDDEANKHWPRFIIIKGKEDDGKFKSLSSLKLSRAIEEKLGEVEDAQRNRDGSLLIHLSNRGQLTEILKTDQLAGIPVEAMPHARLNSCRGVIFSGESSKDTEEELLEWFQWKKFPVTNVKRLKGRPGPRETLLLTFEGTHLPTAVKVGFERCKVRAYIPNPMRCFKCQRFGHMIKNCRHAALCANCGSPDHTSTRDSKCSSEPHCVNCEGPHASFDRKCPKWTFEKKVQEICTKQKVPRQEARRIAYELPGPVSYSNVAQITPRSTPRQKLQLDSSQTYSKYGTATTNSSTENLDRSQSSPARKHLRRNSSASNSSETMELTSISTPKKASAPSGGASAPPNPGRSSGPSHPRNASKHSSSGKASGPSPPRTSFTPSSSGGSTVKDSGISGSRRTDTRTVAKAQSGEKSSAKRPGSPKPKSGLPLKRAFQNVLKLGSFPSQNGPNSKLK